MVNERTIPAHPRRFSRSVVLMAASTISLYQRWNAFKKRTPGRRFEMTYERNHHRRNSRPPGARVFVIGGGVLVMIVGLVFLVLPGPGIPLVVLGAGLLARESKWLAHGLDVVELRLRAGSSALRGWWTRFRGGR